MAGVWRFSHFFLFLTVFSCLSCGHNLAAADATTTIKIGVLARRGPEACLQEWSPTAQYLSERMPDTFKIHKGQGTSW